MTEWKICKVKDVTTARLCAAAGARYIGLHAINGLTREKRKSYVLIRLLLQALGTNCEPVVLTKLKNPRSIARIAKATGVVCLQLHYRTTSSFLERVSRQIQRDCGWLPNFIAVIGANDRDSPMLIRDLLTYHLTRRVIIDTSWMGGTGRTASDARIANILASVSTSEALSKILLAGGISAMNVIAKLKRFPLCGVDVQSSLESGPDQKKDGKLIQKFSKTLNLWRSERFAAYCTPSVSVSLTPCNPEVLNTIINDADKGHVECLHLDDSDGVIAQGFVVDSLSKAKAISMECSCMPYDLHILAGSLYAFRKRLNAFLRANVMLRIVYIHVYGSTNSAIKLASAFAIACEQQSILFGFALHAPKFSQATIVETFARLSRRNPFAWSLVTHSAKHTAITLVNHDVPLAISFQRLHDYALDRDMTLDRLKLFAPCKPKEVIIGRAFIEAKNKMLFLFKARALLTFKAIPPVKSPVDCR